MENESERKKIVLPEELQIEMMNFFLKTSIPRRIKREREQAKEKTSLSNEKIGEVENEKES